jgi:hypothetical protein
VKAKDDQTNTVARAAYQQRVRRRYLQSDIAVLLQETATAISEAEQTATVEKEKALDPALSPDLKAARAAMEDAIFAVGRLRTLQPRLEARYQQIATRRAIKGLAGRGATAQSRA